MFSRARDLHITGGNFGIYHTQSNTIGVRVYRREIVTNLLLLAQVQVDLNVCSA